MSRPPDKLKQAGFVILKHCGVCAYADGLATSVHCNFHNARVYNAGSCEFFDPDETRVDAFLGKDLTKYLDRRRFTRNNRHKQKVSY
jgi:hypothetical protein